MAHALLFIKSHNNYSGVYVHKNGLPDEIGELLIDFYYDELSIMPLIDNGHIYKLDEKNSNSIFYSRDKDEIFDVYEVSSLDEISEIMEDKSVDYVYLFEDGEWKYSENDHSGSGELSFYNLIDEFTK